MPKLHSRERPRLRPLDAQKDLGTRTLIRKPETPGKHHKTQALQAPFPPEPLKLQKDRGFNTGAFSPGVPVLPVLQRFPYTNMSPDEIIVVFRFSGVSGLGFRLNQFLIWSQVRRSVGDSPGQDTAW